MSILSTIWGLLTGTKGDDVGGDIKSVFIEIADWLIAKHGKDLLNIGLAAGASASMALFNTSLSPDQKKEAVIDSIKQAILAAKTEAQQVISTSELATLSEIAYQAIQKHESESKATSPTSPDPVVIPVSAAPPAPPAPALPPSLPTGPVEKHRFLITDAVIDHLQERGIASGVISHLVALKGQIFVGQQVFLASLTQAIGAPLATVNSIPGLSFPELMKQLSRVDTSAVTS